MTKSQPSSMKPTGTMSRSRSTRAAPPTRAAAKAGVDLIYRGDWATEADLDIVAKAGMPIAPVLTSPWIGVEHGDAGRGFGDRVRDRLRAQLDTSFQMIRNARDRGIPILSGSDTGNASAFSHGKWHGKEAELFVKQVGMTPIEAIVANTSGNAAMVNLADEVGVIAPGKLADIVIWDNDPIADITVLQHPAEISLIITDGRIVDGEVVVFFWLGEPPSAHVRSGLAGMERLGSRLGSFADRRRRFAELHIMFTASLASLTFVTPRPASLRARFGQRCGDPLPLAVARGRVRTICRRRSVERRRSLKAGSTATLRRAHRGRRKACA
jgi:hypothetical protein